MAAATYWQADTSVGCHHHNGKEISMDARFRYYGNPVGAQFQQAIGAAGKVVTDSTLPPATLQQADYGRVEIVVVDLEPVEAMTFEAHNDVGPHRARDGHDLGSRECDADKTLKLPRRTTPPATDEPRPGGGIAQTSWPGLVSSRTRRGYGITLLTAYSAWASVNPSP